MSDVTVIGGGFMGLCSAIALQDDGHSVEIVERTMAGGGASYGNCSLLASGEIVPLSRPGVLRKIPKWLLDPEGPLFVRPAALVRELPWLLRFLASGRRQRVLEIAEGLARLTERAEDDFRSLLQRAGLAAELVEAENLMVFDSRADLEHDRFAFELRERFGFGHELLGREELKRLEPDLGGPIACGVLLKRWLHFREPYRLAVALADYFRRRGGRLRIDGVARIRTEAGRAHALVLDSGETLPVRALVVAAGAWSRSLARDLGLRLPLAALQGYHYQVREPRVHLTRAVLYANGGFVLTPLATGLRIGGTIEVSGVDAKPNVRRAKVIAAKAKTILPALDLAGGETWMGPRPFMPDTLPVIGKAPAHPNVVLAFGHGQLGVTLAVTTGKLVADLVAGRPPAIDLTPYRPDRF